MLKDRDPERDYGWWVTPTGHSARLSLHLPTMVLYLHHPTRGDLPLVSVADVEAAEDALRDWSAAGGRWEWLCERLPMVRLQLMRP